MELDPKPGDLTMGRLKRTVTRREGPNRRTHAKCSDDLWLEVKCQSNSEIAGSPRNSFRASVM